MFMFWSEKKENVNLMVIFRKYFRWFCLILQFLTVCAFYDILFNLYFVFYLIFYITFIIASFILYCICILYVRFIFNITLSNLFIVYIILFVFYILYLKGPRSLVFKDTPLIASERRGSNLPSTVGVISLSLRN